MRRMEVRLAIDVSNCIAERMTWWKGIAKDDFYSIASSILDLNLQPWGLEVVGCCFASSGFPLLRF